MKLALAVLGTGVRSAVLTSPRIRPSAADVADSITANPHSYDGPASGSIYFLSRDPVVSLTRSPYAYGANDPLNTHDPSGLFAVGVCGIGTLGIKGLGPIGVAGIGAHCDVVVWGPHGAQVGVIDSFGGGLGLFGSPVNVSGSKSVLISPSAQTLSDLGGRFQYVSGGFGVPLWGPLGVGGEGSYAWGTNACGQGQNVFTFGPSVSVPPGASVNGGVTWTVVHPGLAAAIPDILQQFNTLVQQYGL